MNWRPRLSIGVLGLGVALVPAGCDYSSGRSEYEPLPGISTNTIDAQLHPTAADPRAQARQPTAAAAPAGAARAPASEMQKALLQGTVKLIESAATAPGGDNFAIAVENLNQYFQNTPPEAFRLSDASLEYLKNRVPPSLVEELQNPKFSKRDGRHLEDCLLYHRIATRVAGTGSDLSKARNVFDWIIKQVQLVPGGSLARPAIPELNLPELPQAEARPFDVLLRGMATEERGAWSERGWLFMALCRQLGIDVGLLTYTPAGATAEEAQPWICGAVIDDQVYLFDPRIGMPIPGPDGQGVATLAQAATDPTVLAQLTLPGQSEYPIPTAEDLASSKIVVLIDSSLGYLSPRMRLLEEDLAANYRMVLFRDPATQRDHFQQALGASFGSAELWKLPISVDVRLFQDSQFVTATQFPIRFFDAKLPLLSARLDQLRGEVDAAKEKYATLRFAEKLTFNDANKTPVPREVQQALDMYATYFLALCQLDQGNAGLAEYQCRQTLDLMPEPTYGDGQYYHMFRWGAQANLARLCEAKGDSRGAIAYYCEPDPTPQGHGNLVRARDLVWRDPTAPLPDPVPAPPKAKPLPVVPGGMGGAAP